MLGTIFSVIVIIVCFLFLADTTITFSPFSIKFEKLYYAIGWFLIFGGVIVIRQGEYKAGLQRGVKIAIEEIRQQVDSIKDSGSQHTETDKVEKIN